MRRQVLTLVAFAVVAVPSFSLADEERDLGAEKWQHADWQPFVLTQDATTLKGGTAAILGGMGYDGVTHEAGAPEAATGGLAELWVSGAVGVVNRVELSGFFGFTGLGQDAAAVDLAQLSLRVAVLDHPGDVPIVLTLGGGWQMDFHHDNAIRGTATFSAMPGRLHLTASFSAAHYFAEGRDPVDMSLSGGVLFRVLSFLEVGGEYLAEELEGVVGGSDVDVGEGGRQWAGPSVNANVPNSSLRFNLGAGAVWTNAATGPFVRGSVAYIF
jgi:hypothetical protein